MPRLTDSDYLHIRYSFGTLWEHGADPVRQRFFYLSAREQRDLHIFFQFTVAFSDQAALAHRRTISAAYPSLPQRAGRATARPERLISYGPEVDLAYQRERRAARSSALIDAKAKMKKPRVLSIRVEMKVEPDATKFAQALIQIARQRLADVPDSTAAIPLTESLQTDPRSAGDSSHPSEAA